MEWRERDLVGGGLSCLYIDEDRLGSHGGSDNLAYGTKRPTINSIGGK